MDFEANISNIFDAIKEVLLYKNKNYGNSALSPKNIFYKADAINAILIRLDDKLCRIIANKNNEPRVNDVCDIIGYLALLLVKMNVKLEDIFKLKDCFLLRI